MSDRDLKRERAIIGALLHDSLEAGHWARPETKEYIRKNMIPFVYRDWAINASVPIGDEWEEYR